MPLNAHASPQSMLAKDKFRDNRSNIIEKLAVYLVPHTGWKKIEKKKEEKTSKFLQFKVQNIYATARGF